MNVSCPWSMVLCWLWTPLKVGVRFRFSLSNQTFIGPMTQTRFVLTKALRQNLRPVVVINKVDRPTARIKEVENEILELFLDLEASDAQLDYPILYASAKEGWAMVEENGDQSHGMKPLIDLIIANVDAPK